MKAVLWRILLREWIKQQLLLSYKFQRLGEAEIKEVCLLVPRFEEFDEELDRILSGNEKTAWNHFLLVATSFLQKHKNRRLQGAGGNFATYITIWAP